jgi:hypothetical protein
MSTNLKKLKYKIKKGTAFTYTGERVADVNEEKSNGYNALIRCEASIKWFYHSTPDILSRSEPPKIQEDVS